MKTETRSLEPTWFNDNDKKGWKRTNLPVRDISVKVFASLADLTEFAQRSSEHAEALVEIVNAQLHIKLGTRTARSVVMGVIGAETAEPGNHEKASKTWTEYAGELDYVNALHEAITSPSKRGNSKQVLKSYDKWVAVFEQGKQTEKMTEALGVKTLEELKAKYKTDAQSVVADFGSLLD